MVEYLSASWFDAVDAALKRGQPPDGERAIALAYVITTDEEPITYTIKVTGDVASLTQGVASPADVTFTQSVRTAAAIASEALSAHEAFMTGRLEVTGDTQALVGLGEISAWLDAVLAPVRNMTDYGTLNAPD